MTAEDNIGHLQACLNVSIDTQTIQAHFLEQTRKDKKFLENYGYLIGQEFKALPIAQWPATTVYCLLLVLLCLFSYTPNDDSIIPQIDNFIYWEMCA